MKNNKNGKIMKEKSIQNFNLIYMTTVLCSLFFSISANICMYVNEVYCTIYIILYLVFRMA